MTARDDVERVVLALSHIKARDGVFVTWNTFGSRRTRGLGDYLLSSGVWIVVKVLAERRPDLRYELGDLELGVAKVPEFVRCVVYLCFAW